MIKRGDCSGLQELRMTENINYSLSIFSVSLTYKHIQALRACPSLLLIGSMRKLDFLNAMWLDNFTFTPRLSSDWFRSNPTQHLSARQMCHQGAASVTKSDSLFIYISVAQSVLSKHIIIVCLHGAVCLRGRMMATWCNSTDAEIASTASDT